MSLIRQVILGFSLTVAGALTLFGPSVAASKTCPTLGAIRWDAWFGSKGVPGKAVEKSLGPEQWHDRLPTCAKVIAKDTVEIACDGVDQVILEAKLARKSGIDYWAFVAYDNDNPMSLGLKTYLDSEARNEVNFALISELAGWGDRSRYKDVIRRYAKLMAEPSYQRTPSGRPIFFLGFMSDEALEQRFGGRKPFAAMVEELRELTVRAGAYNPYIVLLDRNIPRAKGYIQDLGLDAVSAYVVADINVRGGEYKLLSEMTAKFWADATAAGMPLVPIAMTGWDRRPRILNPVPWEKGRFSEEQLQRYYKRPTAAELQSHIALAIGAATFPPADTGARSVLIYAWNEFDEGGWLAPTIGEGDSRLRAVREAINSSCPAGR